MNNNDLTLAKFKEKSAKVSRFFESKGYKIPKSTLYQGLSLMFDEKNWNTLHSKLKTDHNKCEDKSSLQKELELFYFEAFEKYFPINDLPLFYKEIKNISELLKKDIKLEDYWAYLNFADNFKSNLDLIGDEDVLKLSLCSLIQDKEQLDLISKLFLLFTTPGLLSSTELNNALSRKPILTMSKNSVKNKYYLYIFFDEGTLRMINSVYDFSQNLGFSSKTNNFKGSIKNKNNEEYNVKEETLSLLDSLNIKISEDSINLNNSMSELRKFFI